MYKKIKSAKILVDGGRLIGRRGSTPVSSILRKSVRFFIINLYLCFFENRATKACQCLALIW